MSDTKPTNPPAFPMTSGRHIDHEGMAVYSGPEGMTLRDYFAAHAPEYLLERASGDVARAARFAYEYADALLRAREEK